MTLVAESLVFSGDHGDLDGLNDDDHTQYLLVDGSRAMTGNLLPNAHGTLDLGSSILNWRTLFLDNNGGTIIDCPPAIGGTSDYTVDMGGGVNLLGGTGGFFRFTFDTCILGGGQNEVIFDLGGVFWASAVDQNIFRIKGFNGIEEFAFDAAFGGWNNPNYGWELNQTQGSARSVIFYMDNNTGAGSQRSIDLRIGGINKLTIENSGDVYIAQDLYLGDVAYLDAWLYGSLAVFDIRASATNASPYVRVIPSGTGTDANIYFYNDPSINSSALQVGIQNQTVQFLTVLAGSGDPVTLYKIGEGDAGGNLASIDFLFANVAHIQFKPDQILLKAGLSLDAFTNGAYFKPRRVSQSAIPTPDANELMIWRDSDDNKTYLVYNDTDEGVRSVEMI